MPVAVFDTMVFVRGLINPHGLWGRLLFQYSDRYTLVFSQPLVIELLDVLRRPEVNRKFRTVAGLDLRRLLQIVGEAAWVDITDAPLVSRDPKDNKFLATANAAGAAYLVSEDQDLLVLGSYQGIDTVPAVSFMRLLDASESRPRS